MKQQLHSRSQYWNANEAAPANGGFVNKASAHKPSFVGLAVQKNYSSPITLNVESHHLYRL